MASCVYDGAPIPAEAAAFAAALSSAAKAFGPAAARETSVRDAAAAKAFGPGAARDAAAWRGCSAPPRRKSERDDATPDI